MPLQSIDLITRLAHRQVNTFINASASVIKQGLPATDFCTQQYQTLKMIANEYTVLHPRTHDPWGLHTVVHCRLTTAVGHGTFQTCVKKDRPSCTCSFDTLARKGLPCPHMIGVYRKPITVHMCVCRANLTRGGDSAAAVAHQSFHGLPGGKSYMAQDFDDWIQNSGLFFANYVYTDGDKRDFAHSDGSTKAIPIPNLEACTKAASQQPPVKMRGLLKSAASGDTRRIRSQGETGASLASASTRKRPPVDIDAQTVQERLQADRELVGKKAMLVYDSGWSRAVFSDKAQTRAKGLPRPVLVLRGAHVRRQDNLLAIEVRCALAPPNDDRNGVRSLLLHRITEFHEVDKITAAMKRNGWVRPAKRSGRARTATAVADV
eukprot:COSAG01_NODE_2710_length_7221_cov_20.205366_6_plen_377_part_00